MDLWKFPFSKASTQKVSEKFIYKSNTLKRKLIGKGKLTTGSETNG